MERPDRVEVTQRQQEGAVGGREDAVGVGEVFRAGKFLKDPEASSEVQRQVVSGAMPDSVKRPSARKDRLCVPL
jgi:hypothetical protein